MADEIQKIKVSELPTASSLANLAILGVDLSTNGSVKALMSLLKGLDGKSVEIQNNGTHLQWRVVGGTWANLAAVADLKGATGANIELQKTSTHMQWRIVGGTWANLVALDDLKVKGDTGASIEMQVTATYVQWRVQGSATWLNLVSIATLKGADGMPVEFQKSFTHIQWRVQGSSNWANLITLEELKVKGGAGKTPVIGGVEAVSVSESTAPSFTLADSGSTDGSGNPIYTGEIKIPKGPKCDVGKTPVFSVGFVTTGAAGSDASASITPDGVDASGNPKYKIDLTIPEGAKGQSGDGSGNVIVSNFATALAAKQYVLKPSANGSLTYTVEEVSPDVANIQISFSEAATRTNINTSETIPTIFGKIKKWFSDLKGLAFKDKADWNTDISNAPTSLPASDVSAWAKSATKPSYIATEVGALPSAHNTDSSSHADIRTELSSVRLIAEGALTGFAFDTVAEMNTWLAVTANKAKLKVGSPLYIRETDVSDYWWDGTGALESESDKVDLSGYLLVSVANSTYVLKESDKSLMTDAERTKLSGIAAGATALSIGETSSTAYRGDRGKTAYDHSQTAHAPSAAQKNSDITKAEIEAKLTGEISTHSHAAVAAQGTTFTTNVLDLTNTSGAFRVASASNATTYTISATKVIGAWCKVLINRATEPAVTGGTKIAGSDFAASTNMYLYAQYDGTKTEYYFAKIS